MELAPVRVNLIAPGFVDTGLSASLLGESLEARREELRTKLPTGRVVGPEDVAAGDIRYTLRTEGGDVLYVQARSVRHGNAGVLARLSRGEHVDASEYVFRTSTQIETAAAGLDWLNKGVFVSVGGRQPSGVIYETYLVQ